MAQTKTKKKKLIAVCGLDCATCPAFIATQDNDDKLREKTAKNWAEEFDSPGIKPEDIKGFHKLTGDEAKANCDEANKEN